MAECIKDETKKEEVTKEQSIKEEIENDQFGYHIKIEELNKRFGESVVIKDLDLEIEPGEFVAIIGHSGCGKSTLLRLIAGLDFANEGKIFLDERKVSKVDTHVRYLFQEARLLPWKSVLNNVLLATPEKNEAKAATALEKVGLIDKKRNWPNTLSGGQKQRVALARALVGIPKLLLLDEPLGALDALTRLEMQDLIEGLWKEQKFTGILVTHDVSEAVRLADRVLFMEDHKIKLDLKITLPRPRVKNNDTNYFEQLILNQVMHIDTNEEKFNKTKPEYLI